MGRLFNCKCFRKQGTNGRNDVETEQWWVKDVQVAHKGKTKRSIVNTQRNP